MPAPKDPPKTTAAVADCTVCGKLVVEQFRPFCSRRCANIDLGRWLNGSYSIPGEPAPPEDDEETKQ